MFRFVKPFLTHARPPLTETMPQFCMPLARLLTTEQQLSQVRIKLLPTELFYQVRTVPAWAGGAARREPLVCSPHRQDSSSQNKFCVNTSVVRTQWFQ